MPNHRPPPPPLTDAQRDLVGRHCRLSRCVAVMYLDRNPDADWHAIYAACDDALILAARKFDPARGFKFSTLYRHAARTCLDKARHEAGPLGYRWSHSDSAPPRIDNADDGFLDHLAADDSARYPGQALDERVAIDALGRLPVRRRDAVRRHYLEGRDYAEIGRECGIFRHTARMRADRGLDALRERLGVAEP